MALYSISPRMALNNKGESPGQKSPSMVDLPGLKTLYRAGVLTGVGQESVRKPKNNAFLSVSKVVEKLAENHIKSKREPSLKNRPLCVPHENLIRKYGYPDKCNYTRHFILPCTNPTLGYLQDPAVLQACGANNNIRSSGFEHSQLKTFGYSIAKTECKKPKAVLLSKKKKTSKSNRTVGGMVPNVVHYVNFGGAVNIAFEFVHHLSILSVHKFVKPERIYFHGDAVPTGEWWEKALRDVDNVYYQHWPRLKTIQGSSIEYPHHESDIIRLLVLLGMQTIPFYIYTAVRISFF